MSLLFLLACTGENPAKDSDPPTDSQDSGEDPVIEPIWDWCPGKEAFIGDDGWSGSLEVSEQALYCSSSNEGRTLPQELAAKSRLRLIPGSYALPTVEGHQNIAVAACTELGPDTAGPAMNGAGATDVSLNSFAGITYTYLTGTQPMLGAADWTLHHTLILAGPDGQTPAPLLADGKENDAEAGTGTSFTLQKAGEDPYALNGMFYAPCMDPTWSENIHTVGFDGGEIEISLFLGLNGLILTGPSSFSHASGTLDGTSFDISSFYQLIYRPGHHHFDRHFAVIFDAPIGEACALVIEDIDYQQGTTTAVIHTATCDLSAIEARSVTSEDVEVR